MVLVSGKNVLNSANLFRAISNTTQVPFPARHWNYMLWSCDLEEHIHEYIHCNLIPLQIDMC